MDIYVARQPIFGLNKAVFGYEFLYRSSEENRYNPSVDGSVATRSLLSNLITEFGLDSLTGGTHAFVNFTRELLDNGCPYLFSPSDFVIEILEDVRIDEALIKQLRELKEMGYILALDDYTGDAARDDLAALVDIIKVDFLLTSPQKQLEIALQYSKTKKLLAEKIETEADLNRAKEIGYTLFQGYYFSRPIVLSKRAAELAGATYARLWKEVRKPEPSFDLLAEMIREDVNLSYKLLTRVNSVYYYRGYRICSVMAALVHMGTSEIRRWLLLILIRDLAGAAGDEVSKRALIRALFSESLANTMGLHHLHEDAYIAGLFSSIDLILGEGMESLLQNLSISDEARIALLGGGCPLNDILQMIKNYEAGNWQALPAFWKQYRLENCDTAALYLRAVKQAESVFGGDTWRESHPCDSKQTLTGVP